MKEVKNASKKPSSLLDEVLNDTRLMKELHALNVDQKEIEDHLSLLATYLDQRDAEEDPKLPAPYPGLKMTLGLDSSGHLCAYFGPNDENKRKLLIEANYLYRDFPDEWCSYTTALFTDKRFGDLGTAFFETFHGARPWVYVKGEAGEDASQFLAALLNNLAESNKTVCFMNANLRFDELKSMAIKDRDSFLKRLDALKQCDCLVIEDFGSEFKSEYVRDQIVVPLLSERSRAKKQTVFVSEYTVKEMQILYSLHNSFLEGKKVEKLLSKNIEKEITVAPGFGTFSRR